MGDDSGKDGWIARLSAMITTGRLLVFAAVLASGATGTGIGWLLGEGAARAAFDARYITLSERVTHLEKTAEEIVSTRRDILSKLDNVTGSLDTIKVLLRRGQ